MRLLVAKTCKVLCTFLGNTHWVLRRTDPMPGSAPPNLPFWDQCVHELKVRHSRHRIRRHPGSPFIYVREMADGRKLGEFSLKPMRWCNRDDIKEARDLCIQGHRKGRWPAAQPCAGEPHRSGGLNPVLEGQARHPGEFAGVVRHQCALLAECMGRDHRVERAD